jgi:hypothetical protein
MPPTLEPLVVRWREDLVVHAATFAVVAALGLVALRARVASWLGSVGAVAYILHAAAIVGVDQLLLTSTTPFVGYSLGIAVVVTLAPRAALAVYALGLAGFVAAITTMQASPAARLASLPNGFTMSTSGRLASSAHVQ